LEWITPVVAVAVAVVAASGAWLTYGAAKSAQRAKREDTLQKRNIRVINYAQSQRAKLEANGLEPDPWPDDLYDE